MFALVREAQSAGVASVRAGVQGSQVDAVVREVYRRDLPWHLTLIHLIYTEYYVSKIQAPICICFDLLMAYP